VPFGLIAFEMIWSGRYGQSQYR